MQQYRTRSMDDIGIGIPRLMPLPVDDELLQEAHDHAAITRGEGLNLARAEIAKDDTSVLRIILTLLKVLVIERTEEFLASDKLSGIKTECKAGCSHCCHNNVEVSIPEAILVALQVVDPVDPRRTTILERADAIADLQDYDRFLSGPPCPLLVDQQCSVYENRPLLCRATLSPYAKGCAAARSGDSSKLQIYVVAQLFALADKDALRGICKDLDLQYDNVDLTQTVAAILRDPTTVVRWAKGERVFKALPTAKPLPSTPSRRATAPAR